MMRGNKSCWIEWLGRSIALLELLALLFVGWNALGTPVDWLGRAPVSTIKGSGVHIVAAHGENDEGSSQKAVQKSITYQSVDRKQL